MFRPLYLEPLEDRSLPSILVIGDVREASVDQGPLEDSTPASAASASRPDAPPTHSSRDAAIFYALEMGTEIHVNEQLDEAVVAHWWLQIDTVCSVASSLASSARGNTVEDGPNMTPSPSPRETTEAASLDRVPTGSEPSGKPSLSAVASPDPLASLGDSTPTNGTEEVFASGPLADAMLLDGWQYGLPAPQADLVPASDKDLTTIAAYLVGSPSAPPAAPPPAKATPASGAETGPTDFIVGFQPQLSARTADRCADSSQQPAAHDSSPAVPERFFSVPSVSAPAPAEPENCVTPAADKNGTQEPSPDVDDLQSPTPELAEMPEEAGGSE